MGLPGIQLLAQKPILMGPSRVGPPILPTPFFFFGAREIRRYDGYGQFKSELD